MRPLYRTNRWNNNNATTTNASSPAVGDTNKTRHKEPNTYKVKSGDGEKKNRLNEATKKLQQHKLSEEQWGSFKISSDDTDNTTTSNNNCETKPQASSSSIKKENGDVANEEEQYHLFDGKILAYYLVSQLHNL